MLWKVSSGFLQDPGLLWQGCRNQAVQEGGS